MNKISYIFLKKSFDQNSNTILSNNLSPNYNSNNFEILNKNLEIEQKYILSTFIKEEYNNTKYLIETNKKSENNYENNNKINEYGKNSFSEISSINQNDNNLMLYPDLTINNNMQDLNHSKITDIGNIFLGQKRKIFKVIYRKNFAVFNSGEYDKESRKLINETLNDINNYDKIKSHSLSYKKIRNIQRRKDNSDNILKKIKSRYHKWLKNQTNEKLKRAGSKKFFRYLPQAFITNLNKIKNNSILNMTYKEILTKNFIKWKKSDSNVINNYLHNKYIFEYLENNKNKFKYLNYNIFNLTYSQLYNEYLESKEFEMEIAILKKKENLKYTKNYIIKANNFINYFNTNIR